MLDAETAQQKIAVAQRIIQFQRRQKTPRNNSQNRLNNSPQSKRSIPHEKSYRSPDPEKKLGTDLADISKIGETTIRNWKILQNRPPRKNGKSTEKKNP